MSDNKKQNRGVGLWSNEHGTIMSHSKGLNKEQIEFLQSLKEGDRIAVWPNSYKEKGIEPDYNMKLFVKKQKSEVEEF